MKKSLRRLSQLVVLSVVVVAGGLVAISTTAQAATTGTPSITYSGVSNPPTADKPQSKLWWNDGSWWANMWKTGSGWSIYRLDRGTATWVDTGVRSDSRGTASSDTLWDGTHLYIASNAVTSGNSTAGQRALLYRYSYSAGKYTLDTGFPATISNNSSESLTIARDSTGVIWATWTQVSGSTSTVFVNSSDPGGTGWGTPFVVPGAVDPNPTPDDLSAIVAFDGDEIGIMWTDQATGTAYWATHTDGDDPRAASSWRHREAIRGDRQVDDHMNIKTLQADPSGRVYAAVKTSLDDGSSDPNLAQLVLVVFKPGTGSFEQTTIARTGDCVTRPQIMLDTANNRIRVFHTAPSTSVSGCAFSGVAGSIYEKTASMDNPVFGTGRGTVVIEDANSPNMNNVTSSKQSVNAATGIVVMATDHIAKRYWFSDRSLGTSVAPPPGPNPPPAPTAPVASFSASPTSGRAPLTVNFSDTSTGSPASWAWNFGDGGTSTTRNPSHTYTAAGTYTVRLTASNAAGSDSSARTITVKRAVGKPSLASTSAHSISGPADIVAAGSDGVLWNYRADGGGGLQPPVSIGSGWSGLKNGFVTDWNQDGVFDLIAQWTDGRMSYYEGLAAGGLAAGETIGSGWSNFQVTVGHWRTTDEYPSVVAYDAAGTLWHYPHTTGTTFGSRAKIGTGWSGLYTTMADYDQDGAQDILAKRSDGSLVLYRSTGAGSFQPGTPPVIGNGWNSINSITKLEGYQGPGSYGLMGRFTDGRLAYYPILNGTWGTRTMEGSGWGPYNIFR
ncbi:PKD domain-containing protein [Arthrobacter sp. ISL-28]|uniref:PKD domain-containing protein n=1 Tax=Arthrobacter sp. ISL-28 TaxID=2819108 RepID=UPI001BE5C50C|nr:PKD domain-containing protein [Arthrobacter sp. ISL-28]MBT2519694.1 PKD domain-containing protein [Arthrobacter sp. ISL-28]